MPKKLSKIEKEAAEARERQRQEMLNPDVVDFRIDPIYGTSQFCISAINHAGSCQISIGNNTWDVVTGPEKPLRLTGNLPVGIPDGIYPVDYDLAGVGYIFPDKETAEQAIKIVRALWVAADKLKEIQSNESVDNASHD